MNPTFPEGEPTRQASSFRHTYSSLPSDGSIRVLELQPGTLSEPIECRLSVVNLSCSPVYDALSYEWGKALTPTGILCDGAYHRITVNLDLALRHFRKTTETRILWVDAICINQDDDVERTQQVTLMGDIYRTADIVLAWLGPDLSGHAQRAFALMNKIAAIVTKQGVLAFLKEPQRLESDHPILKGKEAWTSLGEFASLNYFQRTWILQELGLSKCAVLHWGGFEFPWHSLAFVLLFFDQNPCLWHMADDLVQVMMVWIIYKKDWGDLVPNRRDLASEGTTPHGLLDNFWKVLLYSADNTCFDPRDKVYALLSHPTAHDPVSGNPIMFPDYTKSIEQVYREVAVAGLRREATMVLSSIYHPLASLPNRRLPTWVPNYAFTGLNVLNPIVGPDLNASLNLGLDVSFGDLETKLFLRGLAFDRIEEITASVIPVIGGSYLDASESRIKSDLIRNVTGIVTRADTTRAYPSMSIDMITSLILTCGKLGPQTVTDIIASLHLANFYSYCAQLRIISPDTRGSLSEAQVSELAERGDVAQYHDDLISSCGRKVFRTRKGYIGLAHEIVERGDIVCVGFGCDIPLVLRAEADHYLLLGNCFALGIMRGETIEMMRKGELDEQVFEIH